MKKRKIFITGIAGFIGFHLSLHLKKLGMDVVGIDNFNSYYDVSLKERRALVLTTQGVTVLKLDLVDLAGLSEVLTEHAPDQVVHLAAQAGVRYSLENPSAYMASNSIGFFNILECLKIRKIPCIYASSSSVYGANQKIPFSESDPTDTPLSLYAATKKSNELMAYSYHHQYNIPLIGLRFFTVYGPFGRPDMAYFSFTDKILKGEPITVYDDGNLKRDFTYISDIVDGITRALDISTSYDIFNLGNQHPESVRTLLGLIESYTGKKAIIQSSKRPEADVLITYADMTKSQTILNFHPKVSLQDGMKLFMDWYQKEYRPVNESLVFA